jgi:predicted RNA methylase
MSLIIFLPVFAALGFLLWLFYTRFKGAEYSPTTLRKAGKMLEFADISRKDAVYDLGSGFGRLTVMAGKNAKKATGIEYDFLRWLISQFRLKLSGLNNVEFIGGDFFKQDIEDANVVFMFLRQPTNQKLKPKLEKLRKGTRIVTNTWTFDNWKPVKVDKKLDIYLYVIGESNTA